MLDALLIRLTETPIAQEAQPATAGDASLPAEAITKEQARRLARRATVCTENLIRVDAVAESPKLAECSGCCVSFWPSLPRHSSRSYGLKLRTRCFDIS
jgi:hypothetical protein